MSLIIANIFEVDEILKPTSRKLFKDMVTGDVFTVQSTIHRQGRNSRGKHAVWLKVTFQDQCHEYSYTELDNIFNDIMKVKEFRI